LPNVKELPVDSATRDRDATASHPTASVPAQLAARSDHGVQLSAMLTHRLRGRHGTNPIRVCVSRKLGHDIDGAWWPRVDRIANELPSLVAVLTPLLGDIKSINVNWSPLQRPPDLNWPGWEQKRQHVMTINGWDACANLLVVPYATNTALALMVLRLAADLPIDTADRNKRAFVNAGSILLAAQHQCDLEPPKKL
jgi:Family of unknown function (DUF5994)